LMSHFGSSAIRFRSSGDSSAASAAAANNFKDERLENCLMDGQKRRRCCPV
jgi:hypothetical protein